MATKFKLGVNASFAVNRYPEPEEWIRIVREELGLGYAQFFADLIEPVIFSPRSRDILIEKTKKACERYNVKIHSVFSGTIVHWYNFLLHPEKSVRCDSIRWYENYIDLTARLGVEACGSLMGSFSFRDLNTPSRRKMLFKEIIDTWHHLARVAKQKGLSYIMFEPMSIQREIPCTISQTKELYERLNYGAELPIKLCMDVGHGAALSGKSVDRNPYAWLKELSHLTPVIHIQQTDGKTSKHWPFTPEFNKKGIIEPEKVIDAVNQSGAEEVLLVLEIFHSFFEPWDNEVIEANKKSVEYWRKFIKD